MSKEKAKNNFLGKDTKRLNCYQAVLEAFKEKFNISDEEIEQGLAFGGGKAPDGLCGAVYAVKMALEKNDKYDFNDFASSFLFDNGALRCSELKNLKKSCLLCVEESAKYLEKIK